MDPNCETVWITALDELVCPVCEPLDGERVRWDQPWPSPVPVRAPGGYMIPHDSHPQCRCGMGRILPGRPALHPEGRTRGQQALADAVAAEYRRNHPPRPKHHGPGEHPPGSPQQGPSAGKATTDAGSERQGP
jgi:hypothetical protein